MFGSSFKPVPSWGMASAKEYIALAWQMLWVPWRGFSYNAILWFMLGLVDGIDLHERHRQPLRYLRHRNARLLALCGGNAGCEAGFE